jgi:hypothetical protein
MTNMTTHPSQPGAKTVAQLSIEQLIETVERHANGSRAVGNIAIGDALLRASSFLRAETGQVFASHAQSQARIAELTEAIIRWALGEEGEFPTWPESVTIKGNPKFWWRKELRAKFEATLALSLLSATANPESK